MPCFRNAHLVLTYSFFCSSENRCIGYRLHVSKGPQKIGLWLLMFRKCMFENILTCGNMFTEISIILGAEALRSYQSPNMKTKDTQTILLFCADWKTSNYCIQIEKQWLQVCFDMKNWPRPKNTKTLFVMLSQVPFQQILGSCCHGTCTPSCGIHRQQPRVSNCCSGEAQASIAERCGNTSRHAS